MRHFFDRLVFTLCLGCVLPSALHAQTWLRVNQLGYLPRSVKVAVLVSTDSLPRKGLMASTDSFALCDALTDEVVWQSSNGKRDGQSGAKNNLPNTVKSFGRYGAFARSARLDFSAFTHEGAYYLRCGAVRSPVFRIAADVYDGAADFLLNYMRQQRSGYNPFLRDSCHTHDGYVIYHPTLDSTHIDVSGGWHDASDYLQYVATSANAVFQMLFAYKQHPQSFSDAFDASGNAGANGIPDVLDEAKWGLDWLCKMNPSNDLMFNQLGDDRDHLGFRLPNLDTVSYGRGRERPVYFCTGAPQGVFKYKNRSTGIASTAGKYASAFALGAELLKPYYQHFADNLKRKALNAYAVGKRSPGVCQTAPCHAPYFYEEDNWVDDMELAAYQLSCAFPDSTQFLTDAVNYGKQEPVTPWMLNDTARHYQWYPFVNLGHYFLAQPAVSKPKTSINNHAVTFGTYLQRGIDAVFQRGKRNPFLFGVPFIWCSNNLVSAMLTQARLAGIVEYREMEAALRDWLFGCNPWGTSMIVGLPRSDSRRSDSHQDSPHGHVSPSDAHSAFVLAGYVINGGLVDGPVQGTIYKALKGIKLNNADEFAAFQSDVAVYHDDLGDYSTNEPTMDGTASLAYYLAALQAEGAAAKAQSPLRTHTATKELGGIVRLDSTQKALYLVFTGHDVADGGAVICSVLRKHSAKASFFFTGDFYRKPEWKPLVQRLRKDGHYLGGHSDKHLLYASWERRDSLLVSKEQFLNDLKANYAAMREARITKRDAPYFLPPFEQYNQTISEWCSEAGLRLVNYTRGTSSNADYTYPELGARYVPSDSIVQRIMRHEAVNPSGLNGFLLLMHIGADERRPDKLHHRLDALLTDLKRRGYSFERLRSAQ